MGLEQLYVSHLIKGLSKEEKQAMVKMITEEFIASMSSQDRKELVKILLPDIVDRLMVGTTAADREELVESILARITAHTGETKSTAHDRKGTRSHAEQAEEKRP